MKSKTLQNTADLFTLTFKSKYAEALFIKRYKEDINIYQLIQTVCNIHAYKFDKDSIIIMHKMHSPSIRLILIRGKDESTVLLFNENEKLNIETYAPNEIPDLTDFLEKENFSNSHNEEYKIQFKFADTHSRYRN
jgi:hypothetical protein